MAKWWVYRKGKQSKKVTSIGPYETKEKAQEVVKEGRKYQKEYTWSYASDTPWTHR